jgi:hypothetical protein
MNIIPSKKKYQQQKYAHSKTIQFNLTYEEWRDAWIQSEVYHLRGCKNGNYVMARIDLTKPYQKDNIEIITVEENNSRTHKGKIRSKEETQRQWETRRKKNLDINNT